MKKMLCHCAHCKRTFMNFEETGVQLGKPCPICHTENAIVTISLDMLFDAYITAYINYMKDPKPVNLERISGMELWIDFVIDNKKNDFKRRTGMVMEWLDAKYQRKFEGTTTYNLLKLLDSTLDSIIEEKGIDCRYDLNRMVQENNKYKVNNL